MIKTLLLLSLSVANPVLATSTTAYDDLTNSQICSLVSLELDIAVSYGLLTDKEAIDILSRCNNSKE